MKGMKKTNEGFHRVENTYRIANDVCQVKNEFQVANTCMAPRTVVERSKKRVRKTPRVSAKEIVAILMMILGFAGFIFSLVEAYFMTYPEYYSQYIFMNMEANFGVLIAGFLFFITGLRLAATS